MISSCYSGGNGEYCLSEDSFSPLLNCKAPTGPPTCLASVFITQAVILHGGEWGKLQPESLGGGEPNCSSEVLVSRQPVSLVWDKQKQLGALKTRRSYCTKKSVRGGGENKGGERERCVILGQLFLPYHMPHICPSLGWSLLPRLYIEIYQTSLPALLCNRKNRPTPHPPL